MTRDTGDLRDWPRPLSTEECLHLADMQRLERERTKTTDGTRYITKEAHEAAMQVLRDQLHAAIFITMIGIVGFMILLVAK